MPTNVFDIRVAQRKKRQRNGWTREEILKRTREDHEQLKQLDLPEPDVLISGDPSTVHEEHDDDEA